MKPGDRPTRQRAADRALTIGRRAAGSDAQSQATLAASVATQMVATDVMVFCGVDPGRLPTRCGRGAESSTSRSAADVPTAVPLGRLAPNSMIEASLSEGQREGSGGPWIVR